MSTLTIALLVGSGGCLVPMALAWRKRTWLPVALWATAAALLAYLVSWVLLGLVLLGAAGALVHRRGRSASVVTKWSARSRRKQGVASAWDILRHASWLAMRRRASTLRPMLAQAPLRQRIKTTTNQLAAPLCRTGLLRVWASIEDVVLVFGRPRSGKTQWLIGRVIDAPGAVLVTSTRTDIYDKTHLLRQRHHRPVYVFNPTGLGDLPTTLHFDPLTGCTDPSAAYERATDLLSASPRGGADHAPWAEQARRVLTALLHAAALGELSMHIVAEWVANPDKYRGEVLSLLRRSPSAKAYVPDTEQFLGTNDRTRSSITSTIMPILGWLASPTACAAVNGGQSFDVAELLKQQGTVYLLCDKEAAQVAPLVCALTGLIAREARRIAARAPGGRLDPPLTLVLDECAKVASVPLHDWTSDMGGNGTHIIAAFQSRAQLVDKWGDAGARVILNNAGATLVFALGVDTDDLTHWAALAGERDELSPNHDAARVVVSHSTRRVPVISPSQFTQLSPGRVVAFVRGMPPVMGWAEQAHKRGDVRRQSRLSRRATQAVVAAAEQVTQTAQPAGASSPIPAQRWVVDAHGVTQSPNGTRPVTGETAQEAPDGTH